MELKKFVYFNKIPTNVHYNGVSFPVMPKDIIRCHREFLVNFIDPKWFKEVPENDTRPVRHTIPASPTFLVPDPTKGMPIQSTDKADPRYKRPGRPVVKVLGEEPEDNPYDLGPLAKDEAVDVEEEVVDLGNDEKVVVTTSLPSVDEKVDEKAEEGEDEAETSIDMELPPPPDEKDVQKDEEEVDEGPDIPMRSVLRNETRDDIYARMVGVREAGCPLKPEMLDAFNEFEEDSTRGPMFKALWKYYGYDK